jgi:LmbE family N-acetylglucosaminyl deacetylase
MQKSEGWKDKKKILVILAHPDDPEFFCGGSIARWISKGHEVHYALFTRGDKGCDNQNEDCSKIAGTREKEQREAAKFLGVSSVTFMQFEDGYLIADLDTRKAAVRVIRTIRPDVIVSCDPTAIFFRENYINHPDHLAAGQIVANAVFPAAGNALFFPDLIEKERLQPHQVQEVWFSLTGEPTIKLDVTDYWETKIQALHRHESQIGDFDQFDQHMRRRTISKSSGKKPKYIEQFRRIRYQ